jgi:hypothetical protein
MLSPPTNTFDVEWMYNNCTNASAVDIPFRQREGYLGSENNAPPQLWNGYIPLIIPFINAGFPTDTVKNHNPDSRVAVDYPGGFANYSKQELEPIPKGQDGSDDQIRCLDYLRKLELGCHKRVFERDCKLSEMCEWFNTNPNSCEICPKDKPHFQCIYKDDSVALDFGIIPERRASKRGQLGMGCRGSTKCVDARCFGGYYPAGRSILKKDIIHGTGPVGTGQSMENPPSGVQPAAPSVPILPRCKACGAGMYSSSVLDGAGTSDGSGVFPYLSELKYPLKCDECKGGRYSVGTSAANTADGCDEVTCRPGWYHTKKMATFAYDSCLKCPCGKYV